MKKIQIFHSPALFLTVWHVAGTTTGSQRHCQQKCLKVLHQTHKVYLFLQSGVQTAEYKHLHGALLFLTPRYPQLLIHHLTSPGETPGEGGRGHSCASCASCGGSTVGSKLWHGRLCLLAAPRPAEPGDSCLEKPGRSCCSRALSCVRRSWFSWQLQLSSHRGISHNRQRFPGFPYRNKSL